MNERFDMNITITVGLFFKVSLNPNNITKLVALYLNLLNYCVDIAV